MPRDVQIIENNTLTLFDPIEKAAVVFTHRSPTTDDRVRYMVAKYKRDGDKLIDRTRSALIDAAGGILTGIRPEDFTIGGLPLSSDPESVHFREDWKERVKASAGDLLFLMGHELFEGRISLPDGCQTSIVSEFDASLIPHSSSDVDVEVIPPLANSSGDYDGSARRSGSENARETVDQQSKRSARRVKIAPIA